MGPYENSHYDIEIVFDRPIGGIGFEGCESYEVGSEWVIIRRHGRRSYYKVSGIVSVFVENAKESE